MAIARPDDVYVTVKIQVVRGVEERLADVSSAGPIRPGNMRRRSSARSRSHLNLSSTAPAEVPVETETK